MLLIGVEYLAGLVRQGGFSAKAVLNAKGAVFFSVRQEHRDQKAVGISYEDDYRGNALAAMFAPGRIEIRYHREFADRVVARIVTGLLADPRLAFMKGWQVTYQGRALAVG
jgi:hypothetical protein